MEDKKILKNKPKNKTNKKEKKPKKKNFVIKGEKIFCY